MLAKTAPMQEARIIAIPPPPVRGLGNAGGFKMMVQRSREGSDIARLLQVSGDLIGAANRDPALTRVFTTFGNDTPQIYLDIDRTVARMLNVPLANVFSTLQVNLGGAYVNDFNTFGRIYQVRAQADAKYRMEKEDIERLKVRSSTGALVPMGTLASIRDIAGPQIVQRYNLYYSIPVQGDSKPGVSSGQSLDAMEKLARQTLPDGMSFEWTEIAFQEKAVGNTAIYVFALGVLLVFLVLAAQYESWALPLSILWWCHRRAGGLGRRAVPGPGQQHPDPDRPHRAHRPGGQERDPDRRVRPPDRGERAPRAGRGGRRGLPAAPAADPDDRLRVHPRRGAARLRHRPGRRDAPGARHAVLFGMLGATIFGLFLTPVFYVVIRNVMIRINRWRGVDEHPGEPEPAR